jgi:hypothetical protein
MPIVGVEDGSFHKGITRSALLVAVLFKRLKIENLKTTKITVDGLDATQKLAAVLLAGVSFAGFNIIDPTVIYEKFHKPVVIITREQPDTRAVKRALKRHFGDWAIRLQVFEKLGSVYRLFVLDGEPPVYTEIIGADVKWACKLIQALSACSRIPEPVRVARIIARGLS